jgi:hypothetical protein
MLCFEAYSGKATRLEDTVTSCAGKEDKLPLFAFLVRWCLMCFACCLLVCRMMTSLWLPLRLQWQPEANSYA